MRKTTYITEKIAEIFNYRLNIEMKIFILLMGILAASPFLSLSKAYREKREIDASKADPKTDPVLPEEAVQNNFGGDSKLVTEELSNWHFLTINAEEQMPKGSIKTLENLSDLKIDRR